MSAGAKLAIALQPKEAHIAVSRIERIAAMQRSLAVKQARVIRLQEVGEAIRFGYILERLQGSNQQQRDAELMRFLSQDGEYVGCLEKIRDLEVEIEGDKIELSREDKLHRLELVLLGGQS